MKKTLAAIAVLGAFAGSAMAADVTLYGVVDTGLRYTNSQTTATGKDKVDSDKLAMQTGQRSGNRFGLKGTEDLGNGLVVGFNLENGYNEDDGTLGQGDRLFGREAVLYVQGAFGEIGFGRTGALDAGTGRYNLDGTKATPFGNGWSDTTNDKKVFLGKNDRMDNTITYKTPTFAGVTLYAQASLKKDSKEAEDWDGKSLQYKTDKTTGLPTAETEPKLSAGQEGSSDANRYYAIGATYKAGALAAGVIASQNDWSRYTVGKKGDEAIAVEAYANYDFGMIKPMLAVQYFDQGVEGKYDGYGVVAGFSAPVLGGKTFVQAGYADADVIKYEGAEDQYKVMQVSAGYEYALSKRTVVYAAAGYMQQKTDAADNTEKKVKTTEVLFGMTHTF